MDKCSYGYFVVGKGKYKGQVVYYDDDYTEKSGHFYLGAFRDGDVIMPFSYIEREATKEEILAHEKAGRCITQY